MRLRQRFLAWWLRLSFEDRLYYIAVPIVVGTVLLVATLRVAQLLGY